METSKNQPAQESKLHFLDYWRIIRIRKTVILAVFLLVVLTTTAVTYMLPKSYMSIVRITVEKDLPDISLLFERQSSSSYDPYFLQTQFEVIQSKSVLHLVIEELKLERKWAEKYKSGSPLKKSEAYLILKRMIDVRQFRNTSVIEIRVYDEEKEEAALIANTIAAIYKKSRLDQSRENAEASIRKLKERLAVQDQIVVTAQTNVEALRNKHGISDINPDSVQVVTLDTDTLRRMEFQRAEAELDYVKQNVFLTKLKALSKADLRKSVPIAYPNATQLKDRLQELAQTEQQLVARTKELSEDHPDVKKLMAIQATVDRQVEDLVEGVLSGLSTQVEEKKAGWETWSSRLEKLKQEDQDRQQKYQDYFSAKRHLEAQQQMRTAVSMKINQEEINLEIPKSSIVDVTDEAEEGLRPVRPNIPLNIALGVVVGLIVGVGLAFFIEYLDTSVKTIDDIERALQSPVLGVIPQNVGSLLEEGPESPHAEAYRVLRTNMLFSRKDEKLNTITVVSGGAGEGKSTTLFNLATVFAQAGQRVLIVDSDLRRPSIHKFLKVSNAVGLTNYLLKQNTLEEVIQTTPLPAMDFMPSGKLPNSSMGILSSLQMKHMIQELKLRYEFVFFDSPPIMGVSDASILASEVDLSIQVIQYRKYPQAMTVRAKQMVEKVGGCLLGVVLNNINISQDSYYYYYAGYYYDYYSKTEEGTGAKKNGEKKKPAAEQSRIDLKQKY